MVEACLGALEVYRYGGLRSITREVPCDLIRQGY